MAGEVKYSKSQLEEIRNIFTNEDTLTEMYTMFYNGGKKKVFDNFVSQIVSTIDAALASFDGKGKKEIPELTTLLNDFVAKSAHVKEKKTAMDANQDRLEQATKTLLKIVDRFSNRIFQFQSKDPQKYASTLVKNADSTTKKAFLDMEGYAILARHKVDKKTDYTKEEHDKLKEVFGKTPEQCEKEFSLETIYRELGNSFEKVMNTDFVKNAAKTNYLKNSGAHLGNVLNNVLAITITGLLMASAALSGMPSNAPSFEAVMNYVSTQMLPLLGIGASAAVAVTAARTGITTGNIRGVRNQIRKIEDKDLLFQLVNKHIPTKKRSIVRVVIDLITRNKPEKGKSLTQCRKEFYAEAKAMGLDIDLGKGPIADKNYKLLLEANEAFNANVLCDRTLNHLFKEKRKIEAKRVHAIPNSKTISKLKENSTLKSSLSAANPLCDILDIKGTKTTSRTRTRTRAKASPVAETPNATVEQARSIPIAAREETPQEAQTVETPKRGATAENEVAETPSTTVEIAGPTPVAARGETPHETQTVETPTRTATVETEVSEKELKKALAPVGKILSSDTIRKKSISIKVDDKEFRISVAKTKTMSLARDARKILAHVGEVIKEATNEDHYDETELGIGSKGKKGTITIAPIKKP